MTAKESRSVEKSLSISLEKYIDTRLEDKQEALDAARQSMEKRLEGMNEFRDAIKDATARFMTRDEVAGQLRPICEDIRTLRTIADQNAGKATIKSLMITTIISIVSLITALGLAVFRILGK